MNKNATQLMLDKSKNFGIFDMKDGRILIKNSLEENELDSWLERHINIIETFSELCDFISVMNKEIMIVIKKDMFLKVINE